MYEEIIAHLKKLPEEPLFTTNAEDLWKIYLFSFGSDRQHYNCHTCRTFIERYGALVTITADGIAIPAMWPEDTLMWGHVRRAKVTGVFLSSANIIGTPVTGKWLHLAAGIPASAYYTSKTKTAGQAMAEKREDFKTVSRALAEFSTEHIETALRLLNSEALYRSEKVLGQAQWIHDMHVARSRLRGQARNNVLWRAIATAPAGFCHPRAGMLGTLLEDIAAGMSFDEVSSRFADKMHPLRYQRPHAAPTAGAIAAAEKLVAQLGAAGSLARRFCRMDEVKALWRPTEKAPDSSLGVFASLTPRGARSKFMHLPSQKITWDKFSNTVLPTAEHILFRTPVNGSYAALVTAVNPDAPPILQWDTDDARNPVSWYVWGFGASATSFCLPGNAFVEVDAITLKPSMWNGKKDNHGFGVILILRGAHETRNSGSALFPEMMKSEFHGIRSVIAAYSAKDKISGMDEPHAAGIILYGHRWNAVVLVISGGISREYLIDRKD